MFRDGESHIPQSDEGRPAGSGELHAAPTLDHGGRIYLAKDSFLSPEGFARMYPAAPRFREVVAGIDPEGRLQSSLSRRIGLWPPPGAAP